MTKSHKNIHVQGRKIPTQTNYEHHTDINVNNPFKLRISRNVKYTFCNWHENIEIFYITDGEGYIRRGAEEFLVAPGDIAVINSDVMHNICSDTNVSYYYLIIDEKFCENNWIHIKNYEFVQKINDEDTIDLYKKFIKEAEGLENPMFLSNAKARCALLNLLIDICSKHTLKSDAADSRKNSGEEHVKRAIAYISDNYSKSINLEHIARTLNINKFYLSRKFKEYTGQSMHTYINTLRCKVAEQFMKEGLSVTEAAMESGFETLSYFSRTYKKLYGMSPSKITKTK